MKNPILAVYPQDRNETKKEKHQKMMYHTMKNIFSLEHL
ncbi:hypothetical protein NOC27_1376 [Nitrosococcus oceani AFC27]|nr:hypothetical protein NOC27_1376 [Nitrosococcus oceani AFC27]